MSTYWDQPIFGERLIRFFVVGLPFILANRLDGFLSLPVFMLASVVLLSYGKWEFEQGRASR